MKEEKSGCDSCKKNGKIRFAVITALSLYIFVTSIYGNIILFEKLISLFK